MASTCQQDTIVAVSTPPGRGGISIVRLSGPEARLIAAPLLLICKPLAHAQARFGHLLDLSTIQPHLILDEVVATLFVGPNSYTSEDVLELAVHGSPVIVDHLLRECISRGARLAEPGEFTQRAFLAGRLDLTQAEAVHDLIESTTLHQARLAASQLGGSLSRQIAPAKETLLHLIASLEAGIDFAEDDIDLLPSDEISHQIEAVRAPLKVLEQSFAFGRLIREGFSVAIVGRPNAGKSSLFNALLNRQRAIVTPRPGTTRDLIMERFSLGGIPVELIDTAGIRGHVLSSDVSAGTLAAEPLEEAETLGIAKSREALADADLILLVVDATVPLHDDDLSILEDSIGRPLLVVLNKCDLLDAGSVGPRWQGPRAASVQPEVRLSELHTSLASPFTSRSFGSPSTVYISSLTKAGLTELREAMQTSFMAASPSLDAGLLTNLRQHESVTATLLSLRSAAEAIQVGVPHEVLLLSLQSALHNLDELTGATASDAILDRIFSTFCIGK